MKIQRYNQFITEKLNVSKEESKPFKWYMLCDKLCNLEGVMVKNKMIEDAKEVSKGEFVKNCAYAKQLFKSEGEMKDDTSTAFYKSKVKDEDCYYMQYCGFEYIFTRTGKGVVYWLDEI